MCPALVHGLPRPAGDAALGGAVRRAPDYQMRGGLVLTFDHGHIQRQQHLRSPEPSEQKRTRASTWTAVNGTSLGISAMIAILLQIIDMASAKRSSVGGAGSFVRARAWCCRSRQVFTKISLWEESGEGGQ